MIMRKLISFTTIHLIKTESIHNNNNSSTIIIIGVSSHATHRSKPDVHVPSIYLWKKQRGVSYQLAPWEPSTIANILVHESIQE